MNDDETTELIEAHKYYELAHAGREFLLSIRKLNATKEAAQRGETTYAAVYAAQTNYDTAKTQLARRVDKAIAPSITPGHGI